MVLIFFTNFLLRTTLCHTVCAVFLPLTCSHITEENEMSHIPFLFFTYLMFVLSGICLYTVLKLFVKSLHGTTVKCSQIIYMF